MAYFECIVGNGGGGTSGIPLIVTCDSQFAGLTITATKSGATTQTATCPSSSPYTVEFELPEDGTWTVSGTVSGQTFSEVVTITPYTASLNAIPEGATVTPTDDIQTWLHCAGIFDKAYTTIAQVLNDGTTVTALIASSNAVDYMVRSTTWASSVCANSSAMTKIGANNYCANTLLANTTWKNAIVASSYIESVLNVKVPTMTSNTAPSGECFSLSQGTANPAYYAFNGLDNEYASNSVAGSTYHYIGYGFTSAKKIVAAKMKLNSSWTVNSVKIQASPDKSDWNHDVSETVSNPSGGTLFDIPMNNSNSYRYYRAYMTGPNTSRYGVFTLQFYGREDV